MTTVVPGGPEVGEKLVIVGLGGPGMLPSSASVCMGPLPAMVFPTARHDVVLRQATEDMKSCDWTCWPEVLLHEIPFQDWNNGSLKSDSYRLAGTGVLAVDAEQRVESPVILDNGPTAPVPRLDQAGRLADGGAVGSSGARYRLQDVVVAGHPDRGRRDAPGSAVERFDEGLLRVSRGAVHIASDCNTVVRAHARDPVQRVVERTIVGTRGECPRRSVEGLNERLLHVRSIDVIANGNTSAAVAAHSVQVVVHGRIRARHDRPLCTVP